MLSALCVRQMRCVTAGYKWYSARSVMLWYHNNACIITQWTVTNVCLFVFVFYFPFVNLLYWGLQIRRATCWTLFFRHPITVLCCFSFLDSCEDTAILVSRQRYRGDDDRAQRTCRVLQPHHVNNMKVFFCFYFHPLGSWSIVMTYVCLSVRSHNSKTALPNFTGTLPLTGFRYVMYFRFYKWHGPPFIV